MELSDTQTSWISSILFLGFLIGSVASSRVGDSVGRRTLCLYGLSILAVGSLASSFVKGYYMLLGMRMLTGFGCGVLIPGTVGLAVELMAPDIRGRYTIFIGMSPALGKLLNGGLGLLAETMHGGSDSASEFHTTKHAWYGTFLLLTTVIAVITLMLSYMKLPESPRYLLMTQHQKELDEHLSDLATSAGHEDYVPQPLEPIEQEDAGSLDVLLHPTLRKFSLTAISCLVLAGFTNYNLSFLLPKELSDMYSSSPVLILAIVQAGELVLQGTALLLLDRPNFGRRGSILCLAAVALLSTIALLLRPHQSVVSLVVWNIVGRGSTMGVWLVMDPYIAEAVPTHARIACMAAASSCLRMMAILAPLTASVDVGPILCVAGATIAFGMGLFLPFETQGHNLVDKLDEVASRITPVPWLSWFHGKDEKAEHESLIANDAGAA